MQLIQSVLFRLMQTEKYLKKDSKLIGALAMQKIDIEKSFSHKVCFFLCWNTFFRIEDLFSSL